MGRHGRMKPKGEKPKEANKASSNSAFLSDSQTQSTGVPPPAALLALHRRGGGCFPPPLQDNAVLGGFTHVCRRAGAETRVAQSQAHHEGSARSGVLCSLTSINTPSAVQQGVTSPEMLPGKRRGGGCKCLEMSSN